MGGLDDVLQGGLVAERTYMIRGSPGTGKTILGLQFLTAEPEEKTLCVNFEETTENITQNAESLGIDVSDVEFLDLSPDSDVFTETQSYDVFAPDEVESEGVTERIVEAVDKHDPDRVFVDPVTQLRHFSPDDYQFRKEVASFMSYLRERGATVLFSTQPTEEDPDDDLQFICDGTISMSHAEKGRVIEVPKFRGSDFQSGQHTVQIGEGGLTVFPILEPEQHETEFEAHSLSSGITGLDSMLHGGIERGAVTVISGSSGVGKTTTGTAFMKEAAQREERSVIYLFEEAMETFVHRCESIGIPVEEMMESGSLRVEEMEPLQVSADEFAAKVRREVEEKGAEMVMIDGLSGYRLSIRGDEEELVRELHSLCRYCKNMGVTVVLTDDVEGVTGDFEPTSARISYLADNIMFLRYLELDGQLHKAAGVLKKRASDFERGLREFRITEDGVQVGEPLTDLRGILTGTPTFDENGQ
ncbi:ATPase domain-containing protein [Halolamina litorea]